jgi:hypothetical protein
VRVREGVRGVVGVEEVFDYGAGFEEGDVVLVWVGEDGDAAVRVEGFERFFVQVAKVFEFGFVGEGEFVEDDRDFPWVWALDISLDS